MFPSITVFLFIFTNYYEYINRERSLREFESYPGFWTDRYDTSLIEILSKLS